MTANNGKQKEKKKLLPPSNTQQLRKQTEKQHLYKYHLTNYVFQVEKQNYLNIL